MSSNKIPVSVALDDTLEREDIKTSKDKYDKKRLFHISLAAVAIGIIVSVMAKALIHLIYFITNVSFHGKISVAAAEPLGNNLGLWVIIIPAIGGIIVGLMALYGSKAIRGHGIPEAMEQILTNQSKIRPSITYLKPLSSAICIGTGGPFGAEGPIIATGGALGSTMGQLIRITPNERKILLAAGATAGMSAIFGSPVAAILLAIELLLFEFSPRSFIPVALACITGAAGHHFLIHHGVAFPVSGPINEASNSAILFYSGLGVIMGLLSIAVTKIVYWIEDIFEKLPVHWMWWPAIGGLFVGIIGYFDPRTLGVGYKNITDLLSGSMPLRLVALLCVLKFLSWSISLGSGTSGGTLAPLLTIGGALGVLMGYMGMQWFPAAGISIPLAALVGMSAMLAGASRAFLTSIVFALETTGQTNALLPLLATCTPAYFVSYLIMENTIMTEKIARRGVVTPTSYESDILSKVKVEQVLTEPGIVVNADVSISEVRSWMHHEYDGMISYLVLSDSNGEFKGIVSLSDIFSTRYSEGDPVGSLLTKEENIFVMEHDTLRKAVELMAKENLDVMPVLSTEDKHIVGILSHTQILSVYKNNVTEFEYRHAVISLKRQRLRMLIKGQRLISLINKKKEHKRL
jgi:H+/Cl- antiporter ClcA